MSDCPLPLTWKDGKLRRYWPYHDLKATLLGYAARYETKERKEVIPFFSFDGTKWKAGAARRPRPLYHLMQLASVLPETAYVLEGEKCVDCLRNLGLCAFTSPGGALSATYADWTPLAGIPEIIIFPDNDEAGHSYARDVERCLKRFDNPPKIRIVLLKDLPKGGDVVDWIQNRVPDWNGYDALSKETAKSTREALQAELAETPPVSTGGIWQKPILVGESEAKPYCPGSLPPVVEDMLYAVQEATETPIELGIGVFFAVLATATQGRFYLQLRAEHREELSLWMMTVLPSGTRKTPVFKLLNAPLDQYEQERSIEMALEIKAYEKERRLYQKRRDALERKYANAKKEAADQFLAQLDLLDQNAPSPVIAPRLYTTDATPEALPEIMSMNGERFSVIADEGGIIDIIGGKYNGGEANLDFCLQAFSGSPVRVDRKGRPPLLLTNPALSFGLCVQPHTLKCMMARDGFVARGFVPRFLFLFPGDNVGHRTGNTKSIPPAVRLAYSKAVTQILQYTQSTNGKALDRVELRMDADAEAVFYEYTNTILEPMLREGNTFGSPGLREWALKLQGTNARVAGNLALLRQADILGKGTPSVQYDDVESALSLSRMFQSHALRGFDLMGETGNESGARALQRWIGRRELNSFLGSEAYRENRAHFSSREDVDHSLHLLVENSVVRRTEGLSNLGPKAARYEVNPLFFSLTQK